MRLGKKVMAAFAAMVGLGLVLAGPVSAQAPQTSGDDHFTQIKLTDAHIVGYLAVQKELSAMAQKQGSPPSDKPDPKVQAELDAVAQKHGFKNFVDFDDVAFNISMVMGGFDETGAFTDPITSIKKEIADVTANKEIPEKEKKEILQELNEALKQMPPLQYPENVDVVKKHRAEIEKVLQ